MSFEFRLLNNKSVFIFEGGSKWVWRCQLQSHYNLWYTIQGEGVMKVNAESYELRPGKAFILKPGDKIDAYNNPNKPLTNFAAHIVYEKDFEGSYGVSIRDSLFFNQLAEHCVETLHINSDRSLDSRMKFVSLMESIVRRDSELSNDLKIDSVILSLLTEIDRAPYEEWPVDRMSQFASLSRAQLNRRFIAFSGKSPNVYVIERRMEKACALLTQSEFTVEEISDALGYKDIYFFSRQFKKKIGMSPSLYRKSMRS